MQRDNPSSGFLVVRSFSFLYRRFDKPVTIGRDVYAIPRTDRKAEASARQYRGIDREPLEAWSAEELELDYPYIPKPTEPEACLRMSALESKGLVQDNFIATQADALEVFRRLRVPEEWDLIWAARVDRAHRPPEGSVLLGYEATYFCRDHFSAVCDSMCFPRWHGTDQAGELFASYFQLLNHAALFNSPEDAQRFLQFYRSTNWTETGDYAIAEIRAPATPAA